MSTILQLRNPFETPFTTRPRPMTINTGSPKSNHSDHGRLTSPSASMGPPSNNSPEMDHNMNNTNGNSPQHSSQSGMVSAGNSQGQKVVQTAFIHKLYSMLEDKTIEHLISWSNHGESFVMSPSNEFSKVLAQYFKHTNISSFVRQLNMYGFHKVSDVFHTGSAESALWEFKHGNGNFRKGDLHGLREIKRRASRHTLIHRDSFTNPPKPGPPQPGTPAEILTDTDQRLAYLETMFSDVHSRLCRTEDNYALLSSRCHNLTENLSRCHGWIRQLSSSMHSALPPDSSLRMELANLQKEVERQQDLLRQPEQSEHVGLNGNNRHNYYPSSIALDPPLSPRGYAFSESRRSSIQMEPPPFGSRPPIPPIPPQFSSSSSPRRFGSISLTQTSPGFSKPALPGHIQPHPLSNVVSQPSNLARRHTSADIREHGWPLPPAPNGSSYTSEANSVPWQPSSPNLPSEGDQQLQNQLASYQINSSRRTTITAADQDSLPPAHNDTSSPSLGAGSIPWGAGVAKFRRPNTEMHSAPATRRSSVATLHSLLNPAITAEQENEDEGLTEDRKRKRLI